jgi:hypothetical protein
LYIGSVNRQRGGLRSRIKEYFFVRPQSTQWTNKRINELLSLEYQLKIYWVERDNDARTFEKELLERHQREHRELPPFNRRGYI